MKTIITFILGVFSTAISAQQLHWEGTYGGDGFEDAHVIHEIPGEGYIVMGTSSSFGNGSNDCMLLKLDLNGNELWMKTYGGSGDEDSHYGIITSDGGFAMISYSNSFGAGDYDFYLIRTDENGNTLWTKTYGDNQDQHGYCIQETPEGGFVLVGKAVNDSTGYLDVWMIKTDSAGVVEWDKKYGDSLDDYARFVELTNDGGYIIVGTTNNTDESDAEVYLIKTDSLGEVEWERKFDEEPSTFGYSVLETMTGDYVISGYFSHPTGCWGEEAQNLIVLKVNSVGNEIWRKTPYFWGGWGSCETYIAHSVKENSDSSYLVTGGIYVEVICKTGADPDTGISKSNMLMLRMNTDGSIAWSREYYPKISSGQIELGTYGVETSDSGYIFCAYQGSDYETNGQALIVKTNSLGMNIGIDEDLSVNKGIEVVPNPSVETLSIIFESKSQGVYSLFDINGRRTGVSGELEELITLVNVESLHPGFYNLVLNVDEGRYSKKIIITK